VSGPGVPTGMSQNDRYTDLIALLLLGSSDMITIIKISNPITLLLLSKAPDYIKANNMPTSETRSSRTNISSKAGNFVILSL
jgi:hypothetical protein